MSTLSAVRTHRLCKRVGFLFLIGILIISCSIQKAAGTQSAVDEGDGGSDSSDSEEAGDENIEGYDFTSYFPCPDTPRAFALFVDFSLYVEDEEGRHYTQHTQNEGDLNLNYAIRLEVGGTCRGEKAYLEVLGTYESWSQTIKCPGQAPITRSDADFPAPSLDGEFLLSTAGDLVTEGMNLEQIRYAFRWTLKAYSGDEGPDERPEPPEPLPPISE
ncbi:MAG: hypothetical protein P8Z42_11705 [Anaerolineales bacterium]